MNEEMLPPEPAPILPQARDAGDRPPDLSPPERLKVGLALAGGGFRASFFHLGVLRRLAELDVLRRVEVISTVSGGSIIGALFVLLLRAHRLDKPGRLAREDYLQVVAEMEAALRKGIRRNLRNRLLANPFALFWVAISPFSLGNRMARLYERYLFRDVVHRLRTRPGLADTRGWWARLTRPGAFPLAEIRPVPEEFAADGRAGELPDGIEAFNHKEELRIDGCAVPHLVLNATSMNSGARFWLSSSEVGDWYLGYARPSEAAELGRLKRVREQLANRAPADLDTSLAALASDGVTCTRDEALLALWVAEAEAAAKAEREGLPVERKEMESGKWATALSVVNAEALVTADFGRLREAKVPAWYVRHGLSLPDPVSGGMTPSKLRRVFREALRDIDEPLARDLEVRLTDKLALEDAVMDLVLSVYALRSAAAFSSNLSRDLAGLTIGDAVGASACFPPVFSPFIIQGLYDDAHVGTLGLTDGGVFDNAGVTALLDERCACIIASDTGGVFETVPHAQSNRVGMLARLSTILQADLGRIQRSFLRERRRVNRDLERVEAPGKAVSTPGAMRDLEMMRDAVRDVRESRRLAGLAYFHIESPTPNPAAEREALAGVPEGSEVPVPLVSPVGRHLLARIRTDLDGFGDVEIAALANQGYALADASVRAYLARFAAQWDVSWDEPPAFPWASPNAETDDGRRAAHIVRVGGERFFRSLRLLPAGPSFVPLTVLAVLLVAAALWGPEAAAWAGPHLTRAAEWLCGLPAWEGWRVWPFELWMALALAAVAARWAGRRFTPSGAARTRRRTGWARKYLPWVLPWVLLGMLPGLRPWVALGLAVVVLGLPLYAIINHAFFYLPFRWATHTEP